MFMSGLGIRVRYVEALGNCAPKVFLEEIPRSAVPPRFALLIGEEAADYDG